MSLLGPSRSGDYLGDAIGYVRRGCDKKDIVAVLCLEVSHGNFDGKKSQKPVDAAHYLVPKSAHHLSSISGVVTIKRDIESLVPQFGRLDVALNMDHYDDGVYGAALGFLRYYAPKVMRDHMDAAPLLSTEKQQLLEKLVAISTERKIPLDALLDSTSHGMPDDIRAALLSNKTRAGYFDTGSIRGVIGEVVVAQLFHKYLDSGVIAVHSMYKMCGQTPNEMDVIVIASSYDLMRALGRMKSIYDSQMHISPSLSPRLRKQRKTSQRLRKVA